MPKNAMAQPLDTTAAVLWAALRDDGCTRCGLHEWAASVCLMGDGVVPADGMLVGSCPSALDDATGRVGVGPSSQYLQRVCKDLDLDYRGLYSTVAVKCRPPAQNKDDALDKAVRVCAPEYLAREIARVRPRVILAMGNPAYRYLAHTRSGVTSARGKAFWSDEHGCWVVPTVHPDYVLTNPNYHVLFASDVGKFKRLLHGQPDSPPVEVVEVLTPDDLRAAVAELAATDGVLTFDTETRGFLDYASGYSRVWMVALTKGVRGPRGMRVFAIPLEHPDVNWGGELLWAVATVVHVLAGARLNGHNVKFDMRAVWFLARRYGLTARFHAAFDTMVAGHLLNEEIPKSLETQAGLELGVENWGKGKMNFGVRPDMKGLTPLHVLEAVLEIAAAAREQLQVSDEGMLYYCARDTAYAHMLYEIQRRRLREQQGTARLFAWLVLPGLDAYTQIETTGVWVDVARIRERQAERQAAVADLTARIMEFVPVDFRATASLTNEHFLRRWLFGAPPDGLGLEPVSYTEKRQEPQVNDAVLQVLQHPAMDLLRELRGYVKDLQFFEQWLEWVDEDGRLHPRYNLTGTVTGRRSNDRPNLQQVPRDPYMRACVGAPSGWLFLEVDYSQIEVRLAAWIADEPGLLRIFAEGRDVYEEVARLVLGIEGAVSKEQRRRAKAVVLGFLYGMGARAFKDYAFEQYQVEFTDEEAVNFREEFFRQFAGLLTWHNDQRALVKRQLEVPSPVGRVRHLMRVLSFDAYERGKAERQAINAPVQGTGGDLALASALALVDELPVDEAMLVGDIHDALLFQLRKDRWRHWARRILTVMEAPPPLARFGLNIPVRLQAEGKIGQYWSQGAEFTLETLDSVEPVTS